jgi:hypothetical protein
VYDRRAPTERCCTTAELFQANAALAIPLVWALAKPPMKDRIGALQVCADMEPIPTLTIEQLIQREMCFHTATFAIFGNPALIYLSALMHERLDGSLPGIALLIASRPPDTSPHPREIVDLVRGLRERGRTVGPPPRGRRLCTDVRSEPRPHTHRGQNGRTRRSHALKFKGVAPGGLRAR